MIESRKIKADPEIPIVRTRIRWRGVFEWSCGTPETWKMSFWKVCATSFAEQSAWRFDNMSKFRRMDSIHSAKFGDRKKATVHDQRTLIQELMKVYPNEMLYEIVLEHSLSVLYGNKEIAALLQKIVRERDSAFRKNEGAACE